MHFSTMRINYVLLLCYEKKRASPQIPSWNGFPNARKDATLLYVPRYSHEKSKTWREKNKNESFFHVEFNSCATQF